MRRVSNSYNTTPSEYTSVSVEIVALRSCSGAAYSGVIAAPTISVSRRGAFVLAQQLGDAEVEQLHLALGIDQDVGRLQVAMHDQVLVRVLDRAEHLQEQPQPRRAGRAAARHNAP